MIQNNNNIAHFTEHQTLSGIEMKLTSQEVIDTNNWTKTGDNIYNNNTGFVGINNPTPTVALDVLGDVIITGDEIRLQAGAVDIGGILSRGASFGSNIRIGDVDNLEGLGTLLTVSKGDNYSTFDSIAHDIKLGINNPNPTVALDVVGEFKLNNATKGAGKVLTSDADGLATWQDTSLGYTAENVANKGLANGYVPLNSSATIDLQYFSDAILGQLVYGGGVNISTAVATLTNNAKAKLGNALSTITLTNDATSITGYVDNEGIYYISTVSGTFAGISFEVGDWLISTGLSWQKVDNTDAVASVNGQTGVVTITKSDVGLANVDNTSDANKPVSTAQANADTAVQSFAIQRANHTGTQLANTISDFDTQVSQTALLKANNLSGLTNAKTARVNIGLDKRTTFGNANYTALITDREIVTSVAFTLPRIVTLIAGLNPGAEVIVADEFQTITLTNTLTIAVPTGKSLNGVVNGTEVIRAMGGFRRLFCDGNDNYIFDAGIARLSGAVFTGAITAPTISTPTGDIQTQINTKQDKSGYLTIVSSATPVTLTASSSRFIIVTGSIAQVINLPVTSTLDTSTVFNIINTSTGFAIINSSGGNAMQGTIAYGASCNFYCILTSGTTAASWQQQFSGSPFRTGSGSLVYSLNSALTTPSYSVASPFTAGTNAQGQGQTTTDVTVVTTTANSPSGVTLLSASNASRHQTIINKGTNSINIYPATGGQIDALGTNMPYLLPVNGVMVFNSTSSTQWYSEFDAFVLKGVNNATTTVLTSAQLTTAYPNATPGFRVYCTSIIAGSMVYEKTPTQWIGSTVFTP